MSKTVVEMIDKFGLDEGTISGLLMFFVDNAHPEIIPEFEEHLGRMVVELRKQEIL